MHKITSKTESRLVLLLGAISCILWSWLAGKDLNWDQINYHLYAGHSIWSDRLQQDFLAASIQSYLNPISYIPFYWMVTQQWPDLLIGSLLACFHSLNFYFLYLICRNLWPHPNGTISRDGVWAFLLGAMSPILWQEIGSTFNDITLSALVLLGLYLGLNNKNLFRSLLIGFLLGTATGLKLTFGVFAVAMTPFMISNSLRHSLKSMIAYGLGGVGALLIWHGWWSWKLWVQFENPVFPLFNGIFKSPLFVQESFSLTRFIPKDALAALILPFEMLEPVSWVYTETVAPDLRPFVLLVLLVPALFLLLKKSIFHRPISYPIDSDKQIKLFGFALIAFALWFITSANGRYGLPLALLSGVFLVVLFGFLLKSPRVKQLIFLLLCVLQLTHVVSNTSERWSPYHWGGSWFNVKISPELQKTPALYLSISNQTHAYLSSWLHPQSSIVNLVGQYVLPNAGATKDKLDQLSKLQNGQIFVYYESNMPKEKESVQNKNFIEQQLQAHGFAFTGGKCHQVSLGSKEKYAKEKKLDEGAYVLFCPISPRKIEPISEQLIVAKNVQKAVEQECPLLFKPKGVELVKTKSGYYGFYVGTEYSLHISNDGDVFGTQAHASTDFSLGKVSNWLNKNTSSIPCPVRKRASPWFTSTWKN